MKLYHGTDTSFQEPRLEYCEAHKDFGKGFYLTNKLPMAKDWCEKKFLNPKYLVLEFFVDENFRNGLNVKMFEEANSEWVKFVYANREKESFSHGYDLVIGPVADNGIQKHFAMVMRGEKTLEQIAVEMNYSNFRARQYCFNTTEAIRKLDFIKCNRYSK